MSGKERYIFGCTFSFYIFLLKNTIVTIITFFVSGMIAHKACESLAEIFELFIHAAEWFYDVVIGSELSRLCCTCYNTISHDIHGAFVERWNKETSSFHFSVGEMTITLDDVAYF